MAVIKDKRIQLCICGREEKVETRLAKRRVSSWLGVMATIGLLITILTYPDLLVESIDLKSVILVGLVLYYIIGIIYKTVSYEQKKHTLRCAVRRAFIDVV